MKIFLASDIHTERAQRSFNPFFDYNCLHINYPQDSDVIILAGDIGEWVNGLEWARNYFKNKTIIYILGNHEYYDCDLNIIYELKLKAREYDIHLLDNDSVIIDGVRFLGATLWTDFNGFSDIAVTEAIKTINDYRYIKCSDWWSGKNNKQQAMQLMDSISTKNYKEEMFSPAVAYLLHKKALAWLDCELNKEHDGKTVVISHHAPTINTTTNHSYGSKLEKFIEQKKIDIWCHGHIHQSCDYEISGTRIVCNARGYPLSGISESFNENKLICL